MTDQKKSYPALIGKYAIKILSRLWDLIQDILLEWMLPPIETAFARLGASFRKRFPAKRKKKSQAKQKLNSFLTRIRRAALRTAAAVMVVWNCWALITFAASYISLIQSRQKAQSMVSNSPNSLQCAISPIDKRTSSQISNRKSSEHGTKVSPTDQSSSHIPTLYVQKGSRKYSLQKYIHHNRYKYCLRRVSVDVSNHQPKIDWKKVVSTGVNAAMVRVGYRGTKTGKIFTDESYISNINGALENGLAVGVYFYSQAITPEEAREEADFMIEKIAGQLVTLPVAIDFEFACANDGSLTGRLYNSKLSKEETTLIAEAFCEKIIAAGYSPMVYGNEDMLTKHMNVDQLSKKYYIWLASFHMKAVYEGEYLFWQFTNQGVVNGIDGKVCLNFWYR